MACWFVLDKNSQRQGPLDDVTLSLIVKENRIVPITMMESEGGHRGNAGPIPGLFQNFRPALSQTALLPPQSPRPKKTDRGLFFTGRKEVFAV